MTLESPTEAPPITPGDVLRDELLSRHGITQDALASATRVSRFTINQIINGHRGVTPEMALRFARVLSTTPDFWLNLQRRVDLYRARQEHGTEISALEPLIREQGPPLGATPVAPSAHPH